MKNIFIIVLFATFYSVTAHAQKYDVPSTYVLKTDADFIMYEQQVVNTTDWLQETGWRDKREKRKAARLFILAWVQGAPNISITLNKALNDLANKNPELLFTYTSQFAKYAIQHGVGFDKNKANLEVIRAMLAKYTMEKSHMPDDNVERLIEINKEGNLPGWIAANFK